MRTHFALLAAALSVSACTHPPPTQANHSATGGADLSTLVLPGPFAARPEVKAFIRTVARKHGFNSTTLDDLFARIEPRADIIAKISRPAEQTKPWYAYRRIFLDQQRIFSGVTFWNTYRQALERANQVYGVPAEIIVAILGVETRYGEITGNNGVLEALSTLAFDYPKRADFFRQELEHYLLLTREENIDPLSLNGSYAGAMGLAQFMPSSYRSYAVDFDGDGHRDLWRNPIDAIGSVANYLSKHGWRRGAPVVTPATVQGDQYQNLISSNSNSSNFKPRHAIVELRQQGVTPQLKTGDSDRAVLLELDGDGGAEHWLGFYNFYVITRYNRSPLYAMAVYQLGREIREHLHG
ncbi:MAG: lytic murein transglycosylase B [Gammaproteobacteria bacterium]